VDIDHFKVCNDTHGHLAGDEILRRLGRVLSDRMTRRTDLAYRYGGEEFAIIMPETSDAEAASAMTRTTRRSRPRRCLWAITSATAGSRSVSE
jgi:diguanylate cyclase (GGDEF)-like protein